MKPKVWELPLVLALILALCLWAFWPKHQGRTVSVSINGEQVGTYALEYDRQQLVSGFDSFTLTLVIDGGQAYVEHSTCPDLICQQHAPISKAGDQIICLPARVVVTVTGEEGKVDAITG